MSEDQHRDRSDPAAGRESSGGLGLARQLLDRMGRLARQAREAAEDLAGRLLAGVLPGGAGRSAFDREHERERERERGEREREAEADDHEPVHGPGHEEREGEMVREVKPGRVVLVSRDPDWIFCYWDIDPAARVAVRGPGSKLTLRLQDVTDIDFDGSNGWSQHLYPLTEEARWWHVPVPQCGRHYLAELGYCTPEGTFFALGRSESVATLCDRRDRADEVAVEMATVNLDEPLAPQAPHRSEGAYREDAAGEQPSLRPSEPSKPSKPGADLRGVDLAEVYASVSGTAVDNGLTRSHPGSSAIWSPRR